MNRTELPVLLLSLTALAALWCTSGAAGEITMDPRDEEVIDILIERVNCFHESLRARDWEATCEMIPESKRRWSNPKEREFLCGPDDDEKRFRLLSWEIQEIWVFGTRAKVVLDTTFRLRMWLVLRRKIRTESEQYWIWEQGNWFVDDLIRRDGTWDDEGATRVWVRATEDDHRN